MVAACPIPIPMAIRCPIVLICAPKTRIKRILARAVAVCPIPIPMAIRCPIVLICAPKTRIKKRLEHVVVACPISIPMAIRCPIVSISAPKIRIRRWQDYAVAASSIRPRVHSIAMAMVSSTASMDAPITPIRRRLAVRRVKTAIPMATVSKMPSTTAPIIRRYKSSPKAVVAISKRKRSKTAKRSTSSKCGRHTTSSS